MTTVWQNFQLKPAEKFGNEGFFSKKFLLQCSSGKVECSFDNCAEKLSTEARRKVMKLQLFQPNVVTKNVRPKLSTAVMTTLPEKIQPKPEKNMNLFVFLNEKSSPTMFLWYIRIQFWQPFRKVFAWCPQKNIKMKVFFQKQFPYNVSLVK